MLVQYKVDKIIIISWSVTESQHDIAEKNTHLALNNNHSLTNIVFMYKNLLNDIFLFKSQEEIAKLQRKLERSKKIEMAGAADEVLMAEIAEYKVG